MQLSLCLLGILWEIFFIIFMFNATECFIGISMPQKIQHHYFHWISSTTVLPPPLILDTPPREWWSCSFPSLQFPIMTKLGNWVICPHSRCFASHFDVIFFYVRYLVSSGFSFKPTSSSSTQFSQRWMCRNLILDIYSTIIQFHIGAIQVIDVRKWPSLLCNTTFWEIKWGKYMFWLGVTELVIRIRNKAILYLIAKLWTGICTKSK